MPNIFSLSGKTILITGASSGIGKAVAQQCAAAGASCLITARNEARLTETLHSLDGDGHSMYVCELTNNDDIQKLISSLPTSIHGIACCAGVVDTNLLKFTDKDEIINLFSINVFSTMELIRDLNWSKKLEKESSIVIISSISGVKCGYIGGSIYGATKGAIQGFIKGAALELAPKKIRVNSIAPGMVETNLLSKSSIDNEVQTKDTQNYPLKRYGKPDEVGYAAVYLLSDATKWMTGTTLLIDGGYTLR